MHFKLNSIVKLRLCIAVFTLVVFWITIRICSSRQPATLTKIEFAEDGASTMVTLLPVLVEIFYEALCPDSRSFLLTELMPTYEKIPEVMNVQLIPYGKAKTVRSGNTFKFECQHGPQECLANKVHACGLNLISNVDTRLKYVSCMIDDNWNAEDAGATCAKKYGVDWEAIWKCAKGTEGSKLLSLYGRKTDKLGAINFVPTIALQGNTGRQPAILKDLLKEVCALYKVVKPVGCPQFSAAD